MRGIVRRMEQNWLRQAPVIRCKAKECGSSAVLLYKDQERSRRIAFRVRCSVCGKFIRTVQNASYYRDLLVGRDDVVVEGLLLWDVHTRYLNDPEFRRAVETMDAACPGYDHPTLRDVARVVSFRRGHWRFDPGSTGWKRMVSTYGLPPGYPGSEGGQNDQARDPGA